MLTPEDISNGFNNAGINSPELLAAFLKPSAIAAQLADFDGQLAAIAEKRTEVLGDLQQQTEDITARREEVRKKLQGEK